MRKLRLRKDTQHNLSKRRSLFDVWPQFYVQPSDETITRENCRKRRKEAIKK